MKHFILVFWKSKRIQNMLNARALLIGIFLMGVNAAFSQLKVGDKPTIMNKAVSIDAQGSLDGLGYSRQGFWLPRVYDTSITGIRALSPPDGLLIYHPPSGKIFLRSNGAWVTYFTSAIASIAAGGQTLLGPNVSFSTSTTGTDFTIAGNAAANTVTFNLPDASTTARGLVTTGAQTFGGAKTFANGITVNNGATVNNGTTLNGGTIANGGLSVVGSNTSSSFLALGVTSATTPAASTDRYLSVNSSGIVTLNSLTAVNTISANGQSVTGNVTSATGTSGSDFNIAANSATNTITYNLPSASTIARGAVTTGTQTFGGNKTFNDSLTVNNGTTLNGGTKANGGLNVPGSSGITGSVSNLTLGVTSATTPDATTDRFLSVNSTGQVTLNALSVTTNTAIKIKSYLRVIDGAPMNLQSSAVNQPTRYTFTISGANFSTQSSVVVTPLFNFKDGIIINYSRVFDANTVEIFMTYTGSGTQPINSGTNGMYNITVIEF
jgi:hypothetical protein